MEATFSLSETQRQAGIPIEHLISEIVAFPLASVTAFENPIAALNPDITKETGRLWRETERHISRIGPDVSIDMALAMRDHFWFNPKICGKGTHPTTLCDYLRKLSDLFLDLRGDHAVPRSPASDRVFNREKSATPSNRSNNTLRWLSYSLPVDLLLGSSKNDTCPPNTVEFLPSQLFQNLKDEGFAEPHLHLGASMQFPEYWVTTLNMIGHSSMTDDAFSSPGAELSEGKLIGPWLLRIAIARLFLSYFLYTNHEYPHSFSHWLYRIMYPWVMRSRGVSALETLRFSLMELERGKLDYSKNNLETGPLFASSHMNINPFLRSLYREMINPYFIREMTDHPEFIHVCDPISQLTSYCPEKSPNPEICFTHKSLNYLASKKSGKKDRLFQALFWQVVRMRCIYYRHVTQRPMTPGLLWFIRHYDRIKPGRKNTSTKLKVRTAALTCGLGKGLKSLEVRVAPDNSVSNLLNEAHESIEGIRSWNHYTYPENMKAQNLPNSTMLPNHENTIWSPDIEFGMVIHFVKLRGDASLKGLDKPGWKQTHADPRGKNGKSAQYRYADYYRQCKYQAMLIGRLLLQFPRSLKIIRGVDISTDELGVPSWVLSPIIRYLDDAGKIASHHLKTRLGENVPPLRKTVHTGEDFVHLIGGLRRIDESVRYLRLSSGDRIGHGIALGTNPISWANRTGRVAMHIEDRLFDLVWEKSQYSTHVIPSDSGRLAFIDREINRLSYHIFGKTKTHYELETLIDNLHDEYMMRAITFPDDIKYAEKAELHDENESSQLVEYLSDPGIFRRGHEVEWFSVIPEIKTMITLQNNIRQNISRLGIVVEVNPSSNLLIGNLTDLKNHPFWRLNPPDNNHEVPPVAMCFGSDDPLTFATDLRREYALIYESLIDGGLSAKDAWEWVNRVRLVGMNSRFTINETATVKFPKGNISRYGMSDDVLPKSYWVLDLDRNIDPMP